MVRNTSYIFLTAISFYRKRKEEEKASQKLAKEANSKEEKTVKTKNQRHKENKQKGEIDAFCNRIAFTAGIGTVITLIKDAICIWLNDSIVFDLVAWAILIVCMWVFCGRKILPEFFKKESVGRAGALLTVIALILMLLESSVLKYLDDVVMKGIITFLLIALTFISLYGAISLIFKFKIDRKNG